MRRAVLSAVAAGFAAAALLVTGIAAAAISPSYSVSGLGAATDPDVFRLAGTGDGSGRDKLTWRADLEHGALSATTPAAITGGSFTLSSHGGGNGGKNQLGGAVT